MTSRYKTYPEYKESGIEWVEYIPIHWQFAQLSKLFDIKAGGDLKTEYFSPVLSESHPYPIYTNATDEKAVYGYTCKAFYNANSITVSGRGDVGYAIYRDQPFDAIIRLLILTPRNEIYSKFFMYFIRDVIDFKVESSAIGQLSTNQIAPFKVVFPHFEEQQKIANFLDYETAKIDTLIAKQEKLIELLKEKRQAVISHAVTKGISYEGQPDVPMKHSGVEWLGEVPKHWGIGRLKNVLRIRNGKDYKHVEVESGGYPVYGSGGIFKRSSEYLFDGESVLFGRKGTIDKPLVVKGKFWTVDTMFYSELHKHTDAQYIHSQSTLFPFGLLSTNTALPSMTQEDLLELGFAIPPHEEQLAISEAVSSHNRKFSHIIEKAAKQIKLMKERKTALISAAVTGKIDVRDWNVVTNS